MKPHLSLSRRIIGALCLLLILLLQSPSLRAATETPPPPWPHENSDLAPDPNLVFGRLENGFRYVLLPNQEPRNRVSMHLNVQIGSIHEQDDEQGLAHFLEHLAFCGSKHFPPGELIRYFQKIGMDFGPDANAHTGFNETVYDLMLPQGSPEMLAEGLTVMQDYAAGLLLPPSEIDRERKVVLAEKRTRDSASYRTYEATLQFEFPETILARRLPIGQEEVLQTAGQARFKEFYDALYRPETMALVVVGDFDPQAADRLIKERFAGLKSRAPARTPPVIRPLSHQGIKPFYHFEEEAGNTTVSLEVLRTIGPQPDSAALQTDAIIGDVADRIIQNRLDEAARRPGAPFTSATIGSGIYMNQFEYAEMSAECSPENWDETLSFLETTLRSALTHGVTDAELTRVRKDFLSFLETGVKKAKTRSSRNLAREIIWHLNNDRVMLSPAQDLALYAPVIEGLTKERVHQALQKAWAPDHRLVLVTGNARISADNPGPEEHIRSVYLASGKTEVTPPMEKPPVRFPYLPLPDGAGAIAHKTVVEDLGIVQVDFQNGIRLNLKQTDFKDNEVLATVSFGSGRSSEPREKPGLSLLTEALVNESGLGALDKEDLARALAGKNTRVSFNVGEDRFAFNGYSVTDETELLFQLLQAHLRDPALRENAHALVMAKFMQRYEALAASIEGAMELKGDRFLAGGDPRFGTPSMDLFRTLSPEDVQAWLHGPLRNAPLEISLAGDLRDVEGVIQLAARYFGTLPPRSGPGGPRPDPPAFPAGQALGIDVDTRIDKGIVLIAYPSDDFWDIRQTRRLGVLGDVVSERLRQRIREEMGAAYSTYSYNHPSQAYEGFGMFKAVASVDPQVAPQVIEKIRQLVKGIAKGGIGEDELKRALEPTLTSIAERRRTNGYWLNSVMDGSRDHPEQLDWSRSFLEDYAAITQAELEELARKYLVDERAAVITIRPARSATP